MARISYAIKKVFVATKIWLLFEKLYVSLRLSYIRLYAFKDDVFVFVTRREVNERESIELYLRYYRSRLFKKISSIVTENTGASN